MLILLYRKKSDQNNKFTYSTSRTAFRSSERTGKEQGREDVSFVTKNTVREYQRTYSQRNFSSRDLRPLWKRPRCHRTRNQCPQILPRPRTQRPRRRQHRRPDLLLLLLVEARCRPATPLASPPTEDSNRWWGLRITQRQGSREESMRKLLYTLDCVRLTRSDRSTYHLLYCTRLLSLKETPPGLTMAAAVALL